MDGTRPQRFADRRDAGRQLAERLRHLGGRSDVVILGLPRGGVPVAFEVARALRLPLDVFVVRKLGVPGHEELAMGAVASGGVQILNDDVLREFLVPPDRVAAVARREAGEVIRRERLFRDDRAMPDLRGRTVVLIDDGIATGATMLSAVRAARRLGPAKVIVAAPVIADATRHALLRDADDVVCVAAPESFFAVGVWYDDFAQTSDDEVIGLLRESGAVGAPSRGPRPVEEHEVTIDAAGTRLVGDLAIPPDAKGLVIFAHGSGSSRSSPRNRRVAEGLHQRGFATLLFDLLTPREERIDRGSAEHRFDIALLTERLLATTLWVAGRAELAGVPLGYFGASTGAAAALRAAAARPDLVHTVVSRGGRADLAGEALARVTAPTLLIVGSLDGTVLELNRSALAVMHRAEVVELQLVPGATHLFEEPGALEEVMDLAGHWFTKHLTTHAHAGAGGD